jgi:hypothetical protein
MPCILGLIRMDDDSEETHESFYRRGDVRENNL